MANSFQITISAVDKATAVVQKINAQVNQMMAPFNNLSKSVNNLGKAIGMNPLVQGLQKVGSAAAAAGDKIRSIVAPLMAVIGIGSIAGVAALAAGLGRVQVALFNQATSIGMSTQELQKWQGAAKLTNLSADDMSGALAAVGEKLDNAFRTPETVRDMNAIGIEMHRLKNGSVDTARAILDIAGAMEKQGNVETKKRIADAFGVSAIFPLLVQGRAAVEAFYRDSSRTTKIFTPEEIEQGRKYQQQVMAVDLAMNGLKNSLGIALLPAFERVIGAVDRLVAKYGDVISSKVAEYAERLANWIDRTDWGKVATEVGEVVDKLGGFKTIAIAVAALTFTGPLAGMISLVAQTAKLAAILTPLVANPVVLGMLALTHSSDLNAGEDEALARIRANNPGAYGSTSAPPVASPLTSPVTMDQRKTSLVKRLKLDGYSDAQAAGMVGSLIQESQLDPKIVNPNSGATGIGQWLGSRKKDFEQRYGKNLKDSSFDEQADFMVWELRNTEKRSGDLLRRAQTPEKAAEIHAWEYERPGVDEANIAKRKSYAASVYAAINNQGGLNSPATTQASAGATAGSQVGGAPGVAAGGADGKVNVTVDFKNAPKGVTASVESSGQVQAQIANPANTGGQL